MNVISRIIAGSGMLAVVAGSCLAGAATATSAAAIVPGRVVVVQALPGSALTVSIDGRSVDRSAAVGAVLGPYALAPGSHRLRFTDSSGAVNVESTVNVTTGTSRDVVIHRPAQVGGAPVLNTYRASTAPLGPGKARVLIAHTATVAPADVRVDGKVVFRDIANGEYATADLASGPHTVALLPAGLTTHPILGPLKVDLKAGTVTMVYAVGSPKDHSMNVVVHTASAATMSTGAPATIDTGSAGLVADRRVQTFSTPARHGTTAAVGAADSGSWSAWGLLGGGSVLLLGLALTRRRARAGVRR